jgi:hypothetical protein
VVIHSFKSMNRMVHVTYSTRDRNMQTAHVARLIVPACVQAAPFFAYKSTRMRATR